MAETNEPGKVQALGRIYHGCSSIKDYELMEKLGEGTFGEVYKGKSRKTSSIVALKKILMHNEKDGFPITSLREIKLLKTLKHINVLKLEEMAVERNKAEPRKRAVLYMVTPYMDHDLSGLLDNPDVRMTEPQIKCYMLQLFRGLKYLHNSNILHRDMKAANLLINNRGILQIADFGLARHYDGPVPLPGKGGGTAVREYTSLVVTRWYRPPELLLNLRSYTTAIDMWGAGCVFGEMFKRKPILMGQSDLHQSQIIYELVGSPNDRSMPGWNKLPGCDVVKAWDPQPGSLEKKFRELSPQGLSLLRALLTLDWKTRINAIDALEHPYFKTAPLPARPEDIPRFAPSHELDRRNHRGAKQHLPPAPQGGTVGGGANGDWGDAEQSNGNLSHDKALGTQERSVPRWSQDRGPPGVPHQHQSHKHHPSSRVPPGVGNGPNQPRVSAWQAGNNSNPRPMGQQNGQSRSGLPPPPGEGARHPLPLPPHHANRQPASNVKKDTYIPSYSGGARREERTDERRSYGDTRGGSNEPRPERAIDRYKRENDRRGRDDRRYDERRGRVDYSDLDRSGNDRDGDKGVNAYRNRDNRGGRDRRSTRSRSPVNRDSRDRVRERER